jgi:predicted nuclease of predicted toxin-antitoxin system
MRLLANENIPIASVALLRSEAHDVRSVAEDCPGEKDPAIVAMAAAEDRIIITFDRDYGELIFRGLTPIPAGVIYLRFFPISADEPGVVVQRVIQQPDINVIGQFTVVSRDHIRQRSLPPR